MTRALIYCRISSDPTGRAAGVSRQETECRELADKLGWEVLEVLVDNDISAASGKRRPAYERLLDAIRGDQANAIVAWHTDRLYRRSRDLTQLIDIANEHKIAIRTVTSGDLDLSTASGRMMARVVAAVNEHEVEHGAERMKLAKRVAATEGRWRGSSRPFGYEPDGVTLRPAEAAEIVNATRRVLEGESLASILRDWHAREVPTSRGGTWAMGALRYVLIRARNAALIEHHGEIVGPAQWEPILTEHEWHAIRTLLGDKSRNTYPDVRGRKWLGSGLFLCGKCGDGTATKISTSSGYSAYGCRRGAHLSRKCTTVDEYVAAVMIEYLRSWDGSLRRWDVPEEDVAAIRAETNAIRTELDALRMALGERQIDLRTFQVASSRMNDRLAELEQQMQAKVSRTPLSGLVDAGDVEAAWKAATLERKRAAISSLIAVTLLPAPPGRRPGGGYFDPKSIRIEQREDGHGPVT